MTKRRKPLPYRPPWHRRAGTKAAALAAGAAAALYGGHAGVRTLRAAAAAWPEAAVDPELLHFPEKPVWLQADPAAEAIAAQRPLRPLQRADPELLGRLGAALARSVWIKEPRLHWEAGKLHGEWAWREPVARIPWGDRKSAIFLSADAVVLRPGDLDQPALRRCVRIDFPEFAKASPPEVGTAIADPRVVAAVRLAAALLGEGGDVARATLRPKSDGAATTVDLALPNQAVAHWSPAGSDTALAGLARALAEALRQEPNAKEFALSPAGHWQQ